MKGVATAQGALKIVQTAQNPVKIPGFLVLDVNLLRALRRQTLAAGVIVRAPGLHVRRTALGVIFSFGRRLLGHTLGLKIFSRRAGGQAKPKWKQSGQEQGFSDHWRCLTLNDGAVMVKKTSP
jgi:hypothetical protein